MSTSLPLPTSSLELDPRTRDIQIHAESVAAWELTGGADAARSFARCVGDVIHIDHIPPWDLTAGADVARSLAKRVVDLVGALAGMVLLFPVMVVVALLIRLDSPGPILFRQLRQGRGGRPFCFLKFRTMTVDAEQRLAELEPLNESAGGVLFKIRRDPRVTRLGRFLRRSSLDELPQLFNVFWGEMSLVGPRPLQMRDCELLERLEPEAYARRLTVLPGLTGAWQVGGRSETDCRGMLHLDLDYIDRWSLVRDLMIICRSVVVVLLGRGAY